MLHDYAEGKAQKSPAEAFNRFKKQEQERIKLFLLENDPEKILEHSQSAVERGLNRLN